MEVKLTTNDADIISTGSVIIPKDKYVEFEIENLKFRIEFVLDKNDDGTLKESRIATNVVGEAPEQRLEIRFINHVNLFMATPPSIFHAATINNRSLLLNFAIMSLNNSNVEIESKLFHYTWCLKKEGE